MQIFNLSDFKEDPLMLGLAALVIGFVIIESVFFLVKAWRRGKAIGMSTETLKNAVFTSSLFSVAPAISILVTVFTLSSSLGVVLPWIRLSVVGNLLYEKSAADITLGEFGIASGAAVEDPAVFSAVAWVMTAGICFGLILVTVLGKFIIKKVSNVTKKSEGASNFADAISASAFIGIIAAFVAQSLAGVTKDNSSNAGFMSVVCLLMAVVISLGFEFICRKFNWKKLEVFATPLSIFGALAIAIVLIQVLPEEITTFVWREAATNV